MMTIIMMMITATIKAIKFKVNNGNNNNDNGNSNSNNFTFYNGWSGHYLSFVTTDGVRICNQIQCFAFGRTWIFNSLWPPFGRHMTTPILVNGPGNGFLSQDETIIWPNVDLLSKLCLVFTSEQFHKKWSWTWSITRVRILHVNLLPYLPVASELFFLSF